MQVHLAVFQKYYLDLILEGIKVIDARFSRIRCLPFGKVNIDDKLLLKESGGPVRGEAFVKDVKFYANLTPGKIFEIVKEYQHGLQIQDSFLKSKIDSNYLTIIFLKDVVSLSPYKVPKRDRRGWVLWDSRNSEKKGKKAVQLDLFGERVNPTNKQKISPYHCDCDNGYHTFFKSTKRNSEGYFCCNECGADIIDWKRLHQRSIKDIHYLIKELRKEWWRDHWWKRAIDEKALTHALKKDKDELERLVIKRVTNSVGKVYFFKGKYQPFRDGYQTPYKGNIIFYAQHAMAVCCRTCIEYWHGIPQGRKLTEEEITYLSLLVLKYINVRLSKFKGEN